MKRTSRAALCLALLTVAPVAPARAAPTPASMTIAGGVSLGAYEAGLVYYSLESLRANPGLTELKLATGASAGSVNGFMAILQSCGDPTPDPRQSLFWKAWIPLGLDGLTQPGKRVPTAAFSRAAFDEPLGLIGKAWAAGLRADCDLVFGLSVTRLQPRLVSLKGERITLPRVEEHFVVRVQGRGPGKPPRLTNYADTSWEGEQTLLVEAQGGEVPFPALVDALFASTAFPGAFPPQPVPHCVVRGGQHGWPGCPESAARSDLFVDGGVFDNTPVRLASKTAAAGIRTSDGAGRWLDRPELGRREVPSKMIFNYISTDVRTFPSADREAAKRVPGSLLGVAGEVGTSFYDSARAKNLLYVAEEDPEFFDRLLIPERHLPAASAPLGAFFGFFETGLREFDFALGMYDARRMGEVRLATRLAKAGQAGRVLLPDQHPGAAAAAASWQPYRCLSAVLDAPATAEAACQGEALRDFRIILQSSIERLWDRCASLEELKGVFADDPLCRSAAEGQPPRQVPGVGALPGTAWRRAATENETGYTMRLLAAHRFEFKDLGLTRDQAAEAPARLRARLLEVGRQVARTQPGGEATVVETAVKMAADQVIYVPPRFTGWALVGSDPEFGISKGFRSDLGGIASVRLLAALQLTNTARLISNENGAVALAPLLGVEILPATWASTTLQPSIIIRGGFLFSSRDGWNTRSCPTPASETIGTCSRFVVGAGVSTTVLERVRVQVMFNYYPAPHAQEVGWWAVGPGIGIQFPF
jgi:predicted acylesterase/phospholipase RssA